MTDLIVKNAYVKSKRPYDPVAINLGGHLQRAAEEVPETTALVFIDDVSGHVKVRWSYRELYEKSVQAAQQLSKLFRPGEHVTLWSANRPEWTVIQFGAAMAGLVLVATSPASKKRELQYVLEQSDSVGILYTDQSVDSGTPELLADLQQQLPKLREIIAIDRFIECLEKDSPARSVNGLPEVDINQPAIIQYTSGTTGYPKGAMISHFSLVNTAKTVEQSFGLPKGSVWLNTVPLYTTSGCVFTTLSAIWNRGTQIILPRFDPELVFAAITHEKVNWIPLIPTMAVAVLEHPARQRCDFSSVKVIVAGGSPVAPELVKRVESELKVNFVMVFGQTECSGAICLNFLDDSAELKTATIGYPLGGVELRISDINTGETLQLGETGEICVRGPCTMQSYYRMPDKTAEALDSEGWMHTGDLGTLRDDGYALITGRLKDMIIRGGSNIYPRELEDLLIQLPEVIESAVFGIPEPLYGEEVVAAVRIKPDCHLALENVRDYLAEFLARYKLPTRLWLTDEFPLTPSGKIQKQVLREQYLAQPTNKEGLES